MRLLQKLRDLVFGTEARTRRLTAFWAGTGLIYVVSNGTLVLLIEQGLARPEAPALVWFCTLGLLAFYPLVRLHQVLGLTPRVLAVLQGLFAIGCTLGGYAVSGPMRGPALMILLVILVFCTFSLRPRATMALCGLAIAGLGGVILTMRARYPADFPAATETVHFVLAACSLAAITFLTGEMSRLRSNLKRQKEELQSALATIRTLATMDELTALANRRHMKEILDAAERRQGGVGGQACLALLDIDHFKSINDQFGHAGGDAVLRCFASAARAELRRDDTLGRWGGEEFLLLLPDTAQAEAAAVLKRIAERVRTIEVGDLQLCLRVTYSAGLVERRRDEPFAETIARADHAMYRAKQAGRNQIVSA
jgi:diguanylate cyclase (GGDEF)-like protein